jgi:hypothetical protein
VRSDDANLTDLVEARIEGRSFDQELVRRLLAAEIAAFRQPTDEHAVPWASRAWRDADAWSIEARRRVTALHESLAGRSCDDGCQLISRSDVFSRAGDPVDLFLAAMAWGFGNRGYGWRRTSNILNAAGEDGVAGAVNLLRGAVADGGPAGGWRAWSRAGDAKLRGLGTAFASKVAYFACFDRDLGSGPLIADLNTAWALWALAGTWDSRASAAGYAQYVEWSERQATDLSCRPDDIERALFTLGPEVRRTWDRRDAA